MVLIEENFRTTAGGSNYTLKNKNVITGLEIKLAETELVEDSNKVGVVTEYYSKTPFIPQFKERDSMLVVKLEGKLTITEKQGENILYHSSNEQNIKCERLFTPQSYNDLSVGYRGGMSCALADGSVFNVTIYIGDQGTDKLRIQLIPILTVSNGQNTGEVFENTEKLVANTESSPLYNIKIRTRTLKGTPQKFKVPIVPNDKYGEEITIALSNVRLTFHIVEPHKLVKG